MSFNVKFHYKNVMKMIFLSENKNMLNNRERAMKKNKKHGNLLILSPFLFLPEHELNMGNVILLVKKY